MKKCIVIFQPDGSVSIINPGHRLRKPKETEAAFLGRVYLKTVSGGPLEGLDYEFIEYSKLPDIGKIQKWRRDGIAKKVKIDDSVVTVKEKRDSVKALLQAEIAKPQGTMDVETAVRLQERLRTGQYD